MRSDATKGTNNGLALSADILEEIWTDPGFPKGAPTMKESLKAGGKSRADLWAFAALAATDYSMNMNNVYCRDESKECGHLYSVINVTFPCEIAPSRHLKFYTGRR